jgi:hypothetical protein
MGTLILTGISVLIEDAPKLIALFKSLASNEELTTEQRAAYLKQARDIDLALLSWATSKETK